jgi:hypothetical protein
MGALPPNCSHRERDRHGDRDGEIETESETETNASHFSSANSSVVIMCVWCVFV